MPGFWISLHAIAVHPLGMIVIGLVAAGWVFAALRVRRLGRIIEHLRSLPANKRSYVLERQYEIYPGTKRLPLGFTRWLRRRYLVATAALTGLAAALILGVALQQSAAAGRIAWTLDDSGIGPERYGYMWPLEIRNDSAEPLSIDRLNILVLNRVRRPRTSVRRPDYGPVPAKGASLVMLEPDLEVLPLLSSGGQVSVEPGQFKILRYSIIPNHAPAEGWFYDVCLEASWSSSRIVGYRPWRGSVYRLGWPGMSRWTDRERPVDPDAPPIADAPVALE